jgi:hypothetical protein
MSKQEKPTIQEQATQIKSDIDELRRKWDHLDEANYQTQKQFKISRRIGKAQKKLKKLTDETY